MKIYIDVCCLNRPFDDQSQDRIHLEAEAIISIFKHIEKGHWFWLSSTIVNYEISQTIDIERKTRLKSLANSASEFVSINQDIIDRAKQIQNLGITTYDALHLASAEHGQANIFLSTDDKLIKAAKRNHDKTFVKIENPLVWLQKELDI